MCLVPWLRGNAPARWAAWVRPAAWSLSRMRETWFCTVFREIPRERAICWLLAPSASRSSTSRSRLVKSSGRDGEAGPGSRPGVRARSRVAIRAEGGAARGDGAQRRGDLVGGCALEDVAARAGRQGGEDGVVVIDHGHHEHGSARGDLGCAPGRFDAGGAGRLMSMSTTSGAVSVMAASASPAGRGGGLAAATACRGPWGNAGGAAQAGTACGHGGRSCLRPAAHQLLRGGRVHDDRRPAARRGWRRARRRRGG